MGAGAIRYSSSGSLLSFCNGTTWTSLTGGGGSASLSGLTAATATNTINNATFAQEWQWNTLAGATGLKLSSTSTAAAGNLQKLLDISLSGVNATGTQTTYGATIANTHTGTASSNVGLSVSASGGTNNYALIVPNGNVGIGTAAPAVTLDINAQSIAGTSIEALRITHDDTDSNGTAGIGAYISFRMEDNVSSTYPEAGRIEAVLDDTGDTTKDGSLRLYTLGPNAGAGSNTPSEKVRIDSNGYLGIGDTSPDYNLEVSALTGADAAFALADGDVAHGITNWANTDVFFLLEANSATGGGAALIGNSDSDASGLILYGNIGVTNPTDNVAAVRVIGAKKSTTDVQNLASGETIFDVRNNSSPPAFTINANQG